MKIGWRFPPLSGGTKQGYTNNDIEGFKGEELIDNLAREICQNSLDAHARDNNDPVKVVFEMRKVETNAHEVFSGYEKCLKGCRDYWSRGGAVELDAKLKTFLENAEANAEYKGMDTEKLFIEHISSHRGVVIPGYIPRAFGRMTPFNTPTTHIQIVLQEAN